MRPKKLKEKNPRKTSTISDKKLSEIIGFYIMKGRDATKESFKLSDESINRYTREARIRGMDVERSKLLNTIGEQFTDKELQAIARGGRIVPGQKKVPVVDFGGEYCKIGAITDSHIGSNYFDESLLAEALNVFKKEKVDFITHSGDVTEGMSNRAGHVYELSEIGYTAQKKKAVQLLNNRPAPMYMIDGNHDRWFLMSNGALIVEDIAKETDATFLGHDEGDISIHGGIIKLWHGLDGNSYAHSYRLQKLIEALTGGEKPNVLLAGHVHKSLYIMERHVHCYGVGAIQKQTKWMRGKRIPSHTGFWIIEIWFNDTGVAKTRGTWYPFYQ